MNTETEVHTLSGAYALDALTPQEAAAFRSHLAQCAACREEVRGLREAAADLGAAAALRPPPDLKSRVLAAADRTPQRPPVVAAERRNRGWRPVLAAAAAALVVGVGGTVGIREALDEDAPALSAEAAQVFAADDARTASYDTTNGGELTVAVSPGRGEMAVDARALPDLDEAHVYELWAVRDGTSTSVGLLDDSDTGTAMPIPEDPDTQVAVTVEPAGGAPAGQPTTRPIVTVSLPA